MKETRTDISTTCLDQLVRNTFAIREGLCNATDAHSCLSKQLAELIDLQKSVIELLRQQTGGN